MPSVVDKIMQAEESGWLLHWQAAILSYECSGVCLGDEVGSKVTHPMEKQTTTTTLLCSGVSTLARAS